MQRSKLYKVAGERVMQMFKIITMSVLPFILASSAIAHETGLVHESGPLHSVLSVNHLLILLAVLAVVTITAWRSR